ncbi:MAG TPA: GNAT family N-acetyltransferase [Cyclobacteriaceae bacterium]|nr:GNAT family N-acetyltransferase [Cyclobacteriaceae bacterium]
MEQIIIRLLKEEDIPQINALYKKAYGLNRSDDKFRWEFQQGPVGPAIYVVAVDPGTNKVVGTQCAIPLYVTNSSGQRILTAKSEDTLVDSDYRGRSIFENMYALLFDECRKAGIVAIWGFTYAIKPFRKLGFDIPFQCNFGLIAFNARGAFRYFNSLKEKRSFVEKSKIAGLVTASRLKFLVNTGSRSTDGYKISNDVQDTLEDLTPSSRDVFYLVHDSKFLGWRLRTNPYPNAHLYYSLVEANRSVATIVCTHTNEVSYIMHMGFARNLSQETRERFINAVVFDLSRKTNVLRFWGFVHNKAGLEEIELLKQAGFIFTNQGISFVWKKLDEGTSLDAKNFVLSRTASQGT